MSRLVSSNKVPSGDRSVRTNEASEPSSVPSEGHCTSTIESFHDASPTRQVRPDSDAAPSPEPTNTSTVSLSIQPATRGTAPPSRSGASVTVPSVPTT